MKPCKRLEIVIEHSVAARLASRLDEAKVTGYTVIPGASGRGDRGTRRNDDPTGTLSNCIFIIACETQAEAESITELVRPLLSRSGGICLVSDATWVKH